MKLLLRNAVLALLLVCQIAYPAQQVINVGSAANDGTGDTLRSAMQKANANFTELYSDKQPLDADLTAIAAISPVNDDFIQRKAGQWVARSMAQLKSDLALTKSDVGLGNVENTSDANKPVSTATQAALDLKAPLASPALTGVPTAPTATAGTNTTQLATTAGIIAERSATRTLTNVTLPSPAISSPTGLTKADVGLGNVDNTSDANKPVSTATQTALDLKAPLASPALTGTPTAPTAAAGTNTTQVATTAGIVAERSATRTLSNATISGSSNTISNIPLTTAVTGVLPAANGGFTAKNVQTFTASGTWNKPPGTLDRVEVTCLGSGGAGGGGAMTTSGTSSSGGSGGGGGWSKHRVLSPSALGSTETVTIGATATGGAGATVAGNGSAGANGGSSSFGGWVIAPGGGGGGGGRSNATSGGGGGAGSTTGGGQGGASAGTSGTAGGTAGGLGGVGVGAPGLGGGGGGGGGANGATGTAGGASDDGGPGGGSGGGISTTPAAFAGGSGARSSAVQTSATGGAIGTVGTAGLDPVAAKECGNSGAGGGSSLTGVAGAGGAGGRCAGGGGGGSTNSGTAAAGGNGGAGYCVAESFFH